MNIKPIIIGIRWNIKLLNVAQRSDQRDIIQTAGKVWGRYRKLHFQEINLSLSGTKMFLKEERGKSLINQGSFHVLC